MGAILWWELAGVFPRFLCYHLEFFQILLTGDGSYQYLKDATSFGFLSDKSAKQFDS